MIQISQVKMHWNHTEEELYKKTASVLSIPASDIEHLEIVRQSIDARHKPDIYYIYSLHIKVKKEATAMKNAARKKNSREQVSRIEEKVYHFPKPGEKQQNHPVVIVGTGPAGLFCGYYLAVHGYRPVLLERGQDVDARQKSVEQFWSEGILNPESNVQFGEGGAGTFSDGKLNTLVKDKDGRNKEVLRTFVQFGAKPSILYEAKPHIGTDVLSMIVKKMRKEIERLGGQVRFSSCVTDIRIDDGKVKSVVVNGQEEIPCENLVLAIGHSARDTFSMLYDKKVPMEAKSFAVGLRVEHPQEMINESQYGMKDAGKLGAAPYKVTAQTSYNRGVYSFCMCPGGYVVNASSEEGRTAVNGMSYSGRNGENANSAIIVAVTPKDFGSDHPLAGVFFQRCLEEKAFQAGHGRIPVQRYGIFKNRVSGSMTKEQAHDYDWNQMEQMGFSPCCKGAYEWADVSNILPEECNKAFVEGMESFGRQIKGFDREDAVLLGVESRTSSPVRIRRGQNLQSTIQGLYPCGEGAGYAGGITSAAMDGLRIAEVIAESFAPFSKHTKQP